MSLRPLRPGVHAAICYALWRHQGSSSTIGQPLRPMLGLGQYDRMTPDQIDAAKRLANAIQTLDLNVETKTGETA